MPKLAANRTERLALTLADLDRMDAGMRRKLLANRLELTPVRADDVIVVFACPTLEAAITADIIRGQDAKAKARPTGAWLDRGRGWRKLASDAILTVKVGETYILNPAVFDDAFDAPPPEMDVTI